MTNSIGYCCIPTVQDAGGNYTRFATLWDRGVETPLTVRRIANVTMPTTRAYTPGVHTYDEMIILPHLQVFYYDGQPRKYVSGGRPGNGKYGVFFGRKMATRTFTISRSDPFWAPTDITLIQGKAQYQTVIPKEELINLAPTLVTKAHPIRPTELYQCRSQFLHDKFLPRSNAWQFFYEVWYIFDANRVPDVRRYGSYMGNTRFGIHKYTAEALIKIQHKYPPFLARTTGYIAGSIVKQGVGDTAPQTSRTYLHKRDDEPINKVRRAVTASMALRDTILIDTKVHRKLQLRDIISADGTHTVGELIQV